MNKESSTKVYVSNRVVNAKYGYGLIQERVFNSLIFHLQKEIKDNFNGTPINELTLFKENTGDAIQLLIPLRHIGKPQQYERIKEALKELAGIVVEIPFYSNENGSEMLKYTGLFKVIIHAKAKRTSNVLIQIDKDVAETLIGFERNQYNKPINFTRYMYDVVIKAKKKYTPRIYKLLCSWKSKGEFFMSISDLRLLLGIQDKYKDYCDIKNHVLLPVQRELESTADLWFNCNDKQFHIKDREGGRLHFIIISNEIIKAGELRKEQIAQMLTNMFSFSSSEISLVRNAIRNYPDYHRIYNKIQEVSEVIDSKKIPNKKAYMLKALLNEFTSA